MTECKWPEGTCACYAKTAMKPDPHGRVWMHCEEGLSLSNASMMRFVMYCLTNNIEIGQIHPFNYRYKNSKVCATVRIRPDQFAEFESSTRGKLHEPPRLSLNSSTAEALTEADDDK